MAKGDSHDCLTRTAVIHQENENWKYALEILDQADISAGLELKHKQNNKHLQWCRVGLKQWVTYKQTNYNLLIKLGQNIYWLRWLTYYMLTVQKEALFSSALSFLTIFVNWRRCNSRCCRIPLEYETSFCVATNINLAGIRLRCYRHLFRNNK